MNYYFLLTLAASLQSTLTYPESLHKTNVITKFKSKIPRKFNCKSVKCPPEEEPVCVRVRNKTRGTETKDIHMVLLNKCELEYMKCHNGIQATVVSMPNCGFHGKLFRRSDILKRAKRHLKSDKEDSKNSSENEDNQVLDEQPEKNKSESDEDNGKIFVIPLAKEKDKQDSDGNSSGENKNSNEDGIEGPQKSSGNEGNSVADENPGEISMIPLAHVAVKKDSDGDSSAENKNSNEDDNEGSQKSSGNEGNSVADENPEEISMIPLAHVAVKKDSDGDSSTENKNSNEDDNEGSQKSSGNEGNSVAEEDLEEISMIPLAHVAVKKDSDRDSSAENKNSNEDDNEGSQKSSGNEGNSVADENPEEISMIPLAHVAMKKDSDGDSSAENKNSNEDDNEGSQKSSGKEGNSVADENPEEISMIPLAHVAVKKDSDVDSSAENKNSNEDGNEDSQKSSGNEDNSVADENPEEISMIPLAHVAVKKDSDGDSSAVNKNSNEDGNEDSQKLLGNEGDLALYEHFKVIPMIPLAHAEVKEGSDGNTSGENKNSNEDGSKHDVKEEKENDVEYSEGEKLTLETGTVTENPADDDAVVDVDNKKTAHVDYDMKPANDGVDMEEYLKDCPSFCPARDVMLCARCKDGVYRTFMSVCHMRMFNCRHPKEKVELVSRYPCVLSAPYLLDVPTPTGRVAEPGDVDQVLRYIRCREKMEIAGYNISDSRCDYDFQKTTKSD